MILAVVIAVVATLVITALVTWTLATNYHKKVADGKIGSAEERARKIIDDALKSAEETKREKLLEVKEESLKTRNDLEKGGAKCLMYLSPPIFCRYCFTENVTE